MAKKAVRIRSISKDKPKRQEEILHSWRPCPYGKHWVSAHARNRVSGKGNHFTQFVNGFCRTNPSHHDHLYPDEIHEIANAHFYKLIGPPAKNDLGFGVLGNSYDELIRGWTQYWNEVLQPLEPLDADLVKALIASESSFIADKWNGLKGRQSARGLMQVINATVPLLSDPKELGDYLVALDERDMIDPNLNICSGIRWLFRKKQLVEHKAKRTVTWRDAVAAYKSVKPDESRLMPRFDGYFKKLKETK